MSIIMKIILTYRRTSRLSMRIGKDGSLRVSAPYGYPTKKIDSFIESHREWIAQAQARHEQRIEQENDFYAALPMNTPAEKRAAKQRLHQIIEPMLQHYSQAMQVKVNKLSYRASKSRWGSCQKKTASINFSLYLLLLPEWCIEHVVVHELAHLREANHGAGFYRLMDQYYPRWKEARRHSRLLLKQGSR
ncbi:MAG: M48 family metallopeptidase [Bacteroidales bacterium]|nr:M48 family metallopeptidase [Bacteroidales bacterium]